MFAPIYTILFLFSCLMLILLVALFQHRISVYYVLLFTAVMITNLGFTHLTASDNLQTAIFSNQVMYLGASFSSFFMLMCVADLCHVRFPRLCQVGFIGYGCFIFMLTSTIGVLPLYYSTVSFYIENGVGILQREYGPLHILYPIYLLATIAVSMVMILRSFSRKKDVSYISSTMLLFFLSCMVGLYLYERLCHIRWELMPIGYAIGEAGMLILLRRISLYDVSAISADSMVESQSYGFLLCDSKGNYLGGDETAKAWFPELREQPLDRPLPAEQTALLRQLTAWLSRAETPDIVYLEVASQIIEARHTILKENKHSSVHCVYLRDATKEQEYTRLMEQYNETLARDVDQKTATLRSVQEDIIISMASIVENRDSNTGGHIARTSEVVKIFVRHLQESGICPELTAEMARAIIKAAPLHDFGKIAIPDVILNKPGKFTPEEYQVMKQHSAKGAVIVERILQNSEDEAFRTIAVNVAHYHHEKWNGTGYPDGIRELEIPYEARVMALADVFDALVSRRVYKDRYSYEKAFAIIAESAGSHFDPLLCKEFLKCRPALEALYDSYGD